MRTLALFESGAILLCLAEKTGQLIRMTHAPHAVSRLRSARLARSAKPFLARGGPRGERCAGCRLLPSHCLCVRGCA